MNWRCSMRQQRKRQRRQAGVTLIEMLVVVTIIALFAALVAPNMFRQGDKARVTATRAQINNLKTALGAYKLDTGVFPTSEQGFRRCVPRRLTWRSGRDPICKWTFQTIPGAIHTSTNSLASTATSRISPRTAPTARRAA